MLVVRVAKTRKYLSSFNVHKLRRSLNSGCLMLVICNFSVHIIGTQIFRAVSGAHLFSFFGLLNPLELDIGILAQIMLSVASSCICYTHEA
ncbi:hypothetical protein M758_2G164600 [Ceratodon purpureus]|nr:hypothetical protein M758_2G164600 [Ceratodon purpureus]